MIKIDNKVPVPRSVIDPEIQAALIKMNVGDSFFLEFDPRVVRKTFYYNISVNIRKYRFKNMTKQFKTREDQTGIRVWRTKQFKRRRLNNT